MALHCTINLFSRRRLIASFVGNSNDAWHPQIGQMGKLTDKDLIRIQKLLEISRSSDFPGEAANALAAARRIAAEAGYDLDELMSMGRSEAEESLHAKRDPFGWRQTKRAEPYVQFTTVMYAAEQAAKLARDRERIAAEARRRDTDRHAKRPTASGRPKKDIPMRDLSSPILQRYRKRMSQLR